MAVGIRLGIGQGPDIEGGHVRVRRPLQSAGLVVAFAGNVHHPSLRERSITTSLTAKRRPSRGEGSPGELGREEFGDGLIRTFKETAGNLLTDFGYENNNDWS